jgi:ATP:ADP antiporter, AAA family
MHDAQDTSDQAHESKLPKILLSGAIFFMLLYGYFLLRPLREAMGVERSMRDLRSLFIVTCIVSLVVTLAFGTLVSRANPKRFMTIGYRVVIACLIVFVISIKALPQDYKLYSGYVFYVWLSVVNLFMVSVFWGFMADTWTLADAKKLYPTIGVGGTLGALLGSLTAWQTADQIGPIFQMLAACVCFEIAVQIMRRVKPSAHHTQVDHQEPIGGSWHEGAKTILRSPYLLGIGLYITFIAISSTLIYFTQANIVTDAADELESRIALFAQLDMWTQLATLLVQLFVTAQLIKRLGIGITLCVLPVVTLAGFAALAWISDKPNIEPWQIFAVFAAFNAIHRASRYAIIRPARETLFSVVSRQEKYKAKPIIDVFLYRGGDVAGAGIENALAAATIGIWGMVMVTAPLAVLWSGLAISLAIMQHRRSMPVSHSTHKPEQPQSPTQEALS